MSSSAISLWPYWSRLIHKGVTPNTPFAFTSVPAAKCCLTASMFPLRRSIVNWDVRSRLTTPHQKHGWDCCNKWWYEFLGWRLSSRLGWFSRCFNCSKGLTALHTSRSDGESVRPPSFTRRTIAVRSCFFWYYTMKFGGFHFQRSAASNPFAPTSSMMRWLNTAVAPAVVPKICVFKNSRKHGLKWTLNWDVSTQT